jgi:hypothetical protein
MSEQCFDGETVKLSSKVLRHKRVHKYVGEVLDSLSSLVDQNVDICWEKRIESYLKE